MLITVLNYICIGTTPIAFTNSNPERMRTIKIFFGTSGKWLTLLLVIFAILYSGCVANKYSYKVKGEKMALKVNENAALIKYETMNFQTIPQDLAYNDKNKGFLDMAGKVVSAAVEGVIILVNNEKKKYTANYKNSVGQCYFYNQLSESSAFDPAGMQFTGFTFLRLFKNKKGETDTAVYAKFSVDTKNAYEIINNSMFSLKLDELKVKNSKAKIMAKKWYEPWSWFMSSKYPKLNMDFEIAITSSFVTRDGGIFDNAPVGKFYLVLREIPMDKRDPEYTEFYSRITENPVIGKSFLVPRSFGYYYAAMNQVQPCFGKGVYNIVVNVTESSKENFVSKMLFDNSTEIIKQTGTAIQNKVPK
jgi:hypothetical protein